MRFGPGPKCDSVPGSNVIQSQTQGDTGPDPNVIRALTQMQFATEPKCDSVLDPHAIRSKCESVADSNAIGFQTQMGFCPGPK